MTRKRIGKTRRKLAVMLSEVLGIHIDPADLHSAQGYWRTNVQSEALVWEGPNGIGSWDSMTKCVKNGFTVTRPGSTGHTCSGRPIHIDAKESK